MVEIKKNRFSDLLTTEYTDHTEKTEAY